MEQRAGINFPINAENKRSTTALAKNVLARALSHVDGQAAADVINETAWRKQYPHHYRQLVAVGLASPVAAERIAADGLAALYQEMVFVRGTESVSIKEGLPSPSQLELHTATVQGENNQPPEELVIPFAGQLLAGDSLRRQLDEWQARGIVEPSCCEALRRVQDNPGWLDLSDQTIVLLGAGAEMGPFQVFCRWRANIVAIDLNRPAIWQRLIATARAGNGKLILPLRTPARPAMDDRDLAAQAGVDLIAETPEIATWLAQCDGPLTIGAYAYLDGGRHVRVAVAMDAIMQQLAAVRGDIALAFLPTPTDVYAIPQDAVIMAQQRYEERAAAKLWQEPARALSGDHFFLPNVAERLPLAPGKETGIVDSLVIQQGPNYALAKRIQRWRATVARRQGIRVSSNVAPSTKTASVLKNVALAAAYAGAHRFGMEVFEPETSNALMAALLVHDLRCDGTAADPTVPLDHPAELFMQGANHGGLWRVAFSPRSVLEIAALLGWRTARREARS